MQKYRKKPVVVEAAQWFCQKDLVDIVKPYPDSNTDRLCDHCGGHVRDHGWVNTLEGGHIVCPGDWIIRGVKGEYYPCKPDIFLETYEPVE